MKMAKYYMPLPYSLEILPNPDEGGYVIRHPDLPGCITVGDTMYDALANAENAKRTWIAAALEDGIAITEPESPDDYSVSSNFGLPRACIDLLQNTPGQKEQA